MEKTRVDCGDCVEFVPPDYDDNLFKVLKNAKCKLGKRVMFRLDKEVLYFGGWFRYCEEFNDKINEK